MDDLTPRLRASIDRARARIRESQEQAVRNVKFTRAILGATRTLLVNVGLIDKSKNRVRHIPSQVFWTVWWLLFLIGLILPIYPTEPFLVFPSILGLAIVWLLGMGQFAHTWLGEDLRAVKVTPAAWKVFLAEFQKAGIEIPAELLTSESAEAATRQLETSLPGLVRQSVVDFSSLAAMQALLAGVVVVAGVIVGQTLADIHWWHGWSPVSVLYAAALPTGLSLVGFGLLPFMVARLIAALRLQSEIASGSTADAPDSDQPGHAFSPSPNVRKAPRRRKRANPPEPTDKAEERQDQPEDARPASPPVD